MNRSDPSLGSRTASRSLAPIRTDLWPLGMRERVARGRLPSPSPILTVRIGLLLCLDRPSRLYPASISLHPSHPDPHPHVSRADSLESGVVSFQILTKYPFRVTYCSVQIQWTTSSSSPRLSPSFLLPPGRPPTRNEHWKHSLAVWHINLCLIFALSSSLG